MAYIVIIILAISSLVGFAGFKYGFQKGFKEASGQVVYLDVNKLIDEERKLFVNKYNKLAPEEINEETKAKMQEEIRKISNKIVKAIKENYDNVLIIDKSIEGCVLYTGNRDIVDITEEVIKVVQAN